MIKLSGGSIMTFESGTFEHPVQNSGSFVAYNITHNKGKAPDVTKIYTNDYTGAWVEWFDISGVYGYAVDPVLSDFNTQVINVYRLDSVVNTIKFKLLWF